MVNVAFIIPSTYIGEKNGLALWILVHTSYVILNEWGTQWKGGTSAGYDNTSNYGKKNDVMESCPEFNEDHILFQQFLQKKQP